MSTHLPVNAPISKPNLDQERAKAMRLLARHAEGGWFVGQPELGAVFTGAGTVTANGLMSADSTVPVGDLEDLRSHLSADQLLQSVQVGAHAPRDQVRWAAELGLRRSAPVPTLKMNLTGANEAFEHSHQVRRAALSDSDAMIRCMAIGFGLGSLAETAPFANRSFLSQPEVTGAVVRAKHGDVVSVGVAIRTAAEAVGLYAIATHPDHRRQGHATAVTRALTGWAGEEGAHVAYLQASAEGAPVYEAVGFHEDALRTYLF
jgi:predicted GNAT family acetyltransferase